MKIIETFKEDINNSLKEIQKIQSEGIEQNGPRTKSGIRNNKENTKGSNPGD